MVLISGAWTIQYITYKLGSGSNGNEKNRLQKLIMADIYRRKESNVQ